MGVVRRVSRNPSDCAELQIRPLAEGSLERAIIEGESPVGERGRTPANVLEYHGGIEEPRGKLG